MTARALTSTDEPQGSGAVVVVNFGDYRSQEVWVRSGANVGNWYCLGGEFRVPKVWDNNVPADMFARTNKPAPARPPGTVPQHPTWYDILERGPVTLLTPGDNDTYTAGWRAGRKALWESMENATYDDPPTSA